MREKNGQHKKIILMTILICSSITISYSNSCYTDIGTCGDTDQQIINITTKNSNNGFCIDYFDENKKRNMYCYSTASNLQFSRITANTNSYNRATQGTIYTSVPASSSGSYTKSNSNSGNNYTNNSTPSDGNTYIYYYPDRFYEDNYNEDYSPTNQNVTLPSAKLGKSSNSGGFRPKKS